MLDTTNSLRRVLSNTPLSSYAIITASVFAGTAICARERLSKTITSIALLNLGASSLCQIQSIYPLLQQPAMLDHPELAVVIQCSSRRSIEDLLEQPGILDHPQLKLILEKHSYGLPHHFLQQPGILEHPQLKLILEKYPYGSTNHFLQQPGILDHPQLELILEKCSQRSINHFLQQPGILDHPKIEVIANYLLKQPGILKHPKIELILEKSSCGSTNYVQLTDITSHPNKELILEKRTLRAVANLPGDYSCGMFSVFHYLLGLMRSHETNLYPGGIEINFGNSGLYYDYNRGENWWNYYFDPVNIVKINKCATRAVQFNAREYDDLVRSIEGRSFGVNKDYWEPGISREEANALFNKYFKLKSEIQAEIDQFTADHFSGAHVISVHYRGTDKTCNTGDCQARKVHYEEMIENVHKYIRENHLETFKIFVATDEAAFVQRMQEEFPGKIAVSNAHRSTDGQPLHFNAKNPYETGRESLIDCLLLARGNVLIRTSSNLSKFATYINPDIQVIQISKRQGEI